MSSLSKIEREYLENLGFIYIQHGKFAIAEIILIALSKCFENDFYILRSLAYIKLMQGEKKVAIPYIEKALQIISNDHAVLLMKAMCGSSELKLTDLVMLRKEIAC